VPGAYVNVMFSCLLWTLCSVALPQVLNANLRKELGSLCWAGFISYLIGTVGMLAVAIASGKPWLSEIMAAHILDYVERAGSSVRFRSLRCLASARRQCSL
jgi:uncharacterized membrane protein YdcZ (DUF606 family)